MHSMCPADMDLQDTIHTVAMVYNVRITIQAQVHKLQSVMYFAPCFANKTTHKEINFSKTQFTSFIMIKPKINVQVEVGYAYHFII